MSQNTIPANGKVVITVPTDEITLNAGGTCSINGVTETCSTSGNDIIVSTSSELTAPL